MSPRSEEFLAEARERLAAARDLLAMNHPATALSTAYYAMLYAARAALSEEDRNSKTHSGTWTLFSEAFVKSTRLDPELAKIAAVALRNRLAGDYDAAAISDEVAAQTVADAERFVASIEAELG